MNLTYGGGHTGFAQGFDSFSSLTDPVHISSSNSEAAGLQTYIQTRLPAANISTGADISGTLTFDQLTAITVSRGGGAQWDSRLATTQNITNTFWIVYQTTTVNSDPPSFAVLFRNVVGANPPHYYDLATEPSVRNGNNSFGHFDYRFEDTIASFIPGTSTYQISKQWSAFLVDDTTTGGVESFVIHDGVSFRNTFGAPEPVSCVSLGLGGLLLVRRRRRKTR